MEFQSIVQNIAIFSVPFVMAVVLHEVAHGWVANRFGDSTAQRAGRITLNPLPHLDLIGTVILPLFMLISQSPILFGWARPVPINPQSFSNYRKGLFWVSLAGPAMNFILAIFGAFAFVALQKWVPENFILYVPLSLMAYTTVALNFVLGLFNLIPLPPLDGSKMLESFLGHKGTQWLRTVERYSFYILIALLMTGVLRVIFYPVHLLTFSSIHLAASLLGLQNLVLPQF